MVGQERQEVFAHRCLLACRCNFFQRLLGPELGPGLPSPVVLSTVPAEAFLAVLEFLYTNSVKLHRHSVSPSGRGLGGEGGDGLRDKGNSLPFRQPPPLQVLEVLTAALEYGLEELREVRLCARPWLASLASYGFSSYPASHIFWLGEEYGPIQRELWVSLCVNRHLCGPVCKRIRVCLGGIGGVYGWCCRCQDKLAPIPVLQRETDT